MKIFMNEFEKNVLIFLLLFFIITNISFCDEISVTDNRQLNLNESWLIAVTMYSQGWKFSSGSSVVVQQVKENVACVLPLFVNVSGRNNYKDKNWRMAQFNDDECWILSYRLGCTDDSQFFNYDYCGTKKDVYISTKSGMIRRFASDTDIAKIPAVFEGIHYAFNQVLDSLPIQTIPQNDKYKESAIETDKNENRYKIKINRQSNNGETVLTLILYSPSNIEESRVVQYWNENSNWWNKYEYWDHGNKVLTARLLKHVPADGFCEWSYQDDKKISNAAFVSDDRKTVFLKRRDNSELSIPIKQLSIGDNWHIKFTILAEQNEKRKWNTPDGQSTITGKYIFSDGKKVKIDVDDGRILTLDFSTLSSVDKDYVNCKIAERNKSKIKFMNFSDTRDIR
jgi:hypothetical protein